MGGKVMVRQSYVFNVKMFCHYAAESSVDDGGMMYGQEQTENLSFELKKEGKYIDGWRIAFYG